MSNKLAVNVTEFLKRDDVKARFAEILGDRSNAYLSSVLSIVSQNDKLKQADPQSVYMCAMMAATLNLPVNPNLGVAYIIPYQDKDKGLIATFQLGYKAFIQLAQRSGQFKNISATPIYEGQIISENPLTGYEFDFTKKGTKVIGYAGYFKLINGFEKTLYMDMATIEAHAKKYSQTYKKGFGLWRDNFDAMAQKTVIKILLSKFAPLSVEMQKAVLADQAKINDAETVDVDYIDNDAKELPVDKEQERIQLMLNRCFTTQEVEVLADSLDDTDKAKYNEIINARKTELAK